ALPIFSAYGAIMQALFSRERTGEGASLEASLFDTLAEWMTVPLLHYTHGGKAPERIGMRHPILAPYGAYDTGDGKTVVFGVQNEREWQRFCAIVLLQPECGEDPRFCSNGLRVANRTDLDRLLERVFAD